MQWLPAMLLVAVTTLSAQETELYRLETGRIIVDQQEHFSSWTKAPGTVEEVVNDVTGAFEGLRPRLWRRVTNALQGDIVADLARNPPKRLLDAKVDPAEFTILNAVETGLLNSKEEVLKVFDNSLETWWEPVFPESHSSDIVGAEAFFTIDIGRIVLADKIVLKFADEENGDPFLLFDVFTSDGVNHGSVDPKIESPEYLKVFSMLRPNKTQREFEIDLTRFNNNAEQEKRLVNYIKVVVTSSAYERGRQVTQEEYESLRATAPQDTGMVEHTRRLYSGALIQVDRGVWEQLEGDSQGPIRYWQRERPRLAEVQVWGEGDDMFQGVKERCASPPCITLTAKVPGGPIAPWDDQLLDGNLKSRVPMDVDPGISTQADLLRQLFVDLGATFWIESYRHTILMDIGHAATLGPWSLDFSDGSKDPNGDFSWNRVYTVEQDVTNTLGPTRLESVDFERVKARYMRLEYLQSNKLSSPGNDVNLSEVQLLGEGYQPEVILVSDAISLPSSSNLVSIEWKADTPPGTSVTVRTRTGTGLDELQCFYKLFGGKQRPLVGADGTPESVDADFCAITGTDKEAELAVTHEKPGRGAKVGEITTSVFVDESKFSTWSEPYTDPSGSAITSPSPRPVLLISVMMESDDPDEHATLKSVTLNFDEPVANRLIGTVTPTRVEQLAVDQAFSLVVELDTLQLGLDELLLVPPAGLELMREPAPILYTGTLDGLQDGQDMSALVRDSNLLPPSEGTEVGDRLHLSFAAIEDGGSVPEAIRLEFTGRLFSPGGRLQAQLRNSQSDGANWQRVDQVRNSLVLLAQPKQKELFKDLAIVPVAFTPNGDDRNEEMNVSFTLLSVGVDTGVAVEIYDLSGRLVWRKEEQREDSTGSYAIPWNGRDAAGVLVAPGVYAVRVKLVGATSGSGLDEVEQLRTVAVAY